MRRRPDARAREGHAAAVSPVIGTGIFFESSRPARALIERIPALERSRQELLRRVEVGRVAVGEEAAVAGEGVEALAGRVAVPFVPALSGDLAEELSPQVVLAPPVPVVAGQRHESLAQGLDHVWVREDEGTPRHTVVSRDEPMEGEEAIREAISVAERRGSPKR
jgi:hypothetical protein